jgi:hypothetical protein
MSSPTELELAPQLRTHTPSAPDTHSKALRVNLDPLRYGTFAEIGAGQEVVRWFFRAGGAAGTVAKSISAYDMAVSDAIYGRDAGVRYVSRPRLEAMLDHEHDLTLQRLGPARGGSTAFFTFGDTVAARSFRGNNECHGWMGVKFQPRPLDPPSRIVIHVRMLDRDAPAQQEALGVVGVNLLYAAFFHTGEPEALVDSLLDNLTPARIEIDVIELSGPAFRQVDNRLMSMKLVELGLSGAAMFGPDGRVLQPSEALYKKNILVERGSFRPLCHVHLDMLQGAQADLQRDSAGTDYVEVMELTMRNLRDGGETVDRADFLARADMLAAVGKTVLISDYFDFYRLAGYLRRYTKNRIALVLGAGSLRELYDERSYAHLDGGLLEAFGRLFKNDLRLYVYPLRDPATGALTTVDNLPLDETLKGLHTFMQASGALRPITSYRPEHLPIFSRDALARLRAGDPSWQKMVPEAVAEVIRARGYFGHRAAAATATTTPAAAEREAA